MGGGARARAEVARARAHAATVRARNSASQLEKITEQVEKLELSGVLFFQITFGPGCAVGVIAPVAKVLLGFGMLRLAAAVDGRSHAPYACGSIWSLQCRACR